MFLELLEGGDLRLELRLSPPSCRAQHITRDEDDWRSDYDSLTFAVLDSAVLVSEVLDSAFLALAVLDSSNLVSVLLVSVILVYVVLYQQF